MAHSKWRELDEILWNQRKHDKSSLIDAMIFVFNPLTIVQSWKYFTSALLVKQIQLFYFHVISLHGHKNDNWKTQWNHNNWSFCGSSAWFDILSFILWIHVVTFRMSHVYISFCITAKLIGNWETSRTIPRNHYFECRSVFRNTFHVLFIYSECTPFDV